MTVVMLAAGTSSRMGKINKLLLDIDGKFMVERCCQNALDYLASLDEDATLIVVTGYRSTSCEKALKSCKEFVSNSSNLKLIIVKNRDYRKGQFSSAKVGVNQVPDGDDFFISLADMPKVKAENYSSLVGKLKGFDAVRPFVDEQPGHPVLLSSEMKEKILSKDDSWTVSRILRECKVKELSFSDSSWIYDIDSI